MAIRGDAWEQLGGFRETSFMYAEDIDLCWRLRSLGRKTRFVAESEFVHLGASSSSVRWDDRERAERIGRAEAHIIRENLPRRSAAASIAFMRFGLAARVLAFRLLRNRQGTETCRGFLRGMKLDPLGDSDRRLPEATVEVVRPQTSAG
jgi:GT2 family glycosyltransferase